VSASATDHSEAKPSKLQGHYINGEFVPSVSGATFQSVNPYTEEINYRAARGTAEDVDRAVAAARRAFESQAWSGLTATKRGRLVSHLGELIAENAEELAFLESRDNGKLLREAREQLNKIPDFYFYFGGYADKILGAVIPSYDGASLAYTLREPIGVVGAIIPWNSPLQLATYKLAPALATGNTVVLKPSEHTSASALRLMELVDQAGFPKGVVNVVTGLGDAGAALAAHPGIDKVAFTGGTATGRSVAHAAVDHFARLTLELGGKSPQIVFPDADPQAVATGVISGIFAAGGQTCVAGSRAFLHAALYDEVLERVRDRTEQIIIGDPMKPETELGPLCFEGHRSRVEEFISSGLSEGATLVTGGKRPDQPHGFFIEPTVFGDVQPGMTIAQEEIFGPVLSVFRWEDEADVIAKANDTIYGLAAGIWTKDVARAHRVAARINAGTVWVNKYRASNPLVPFGGFGASGLGKENGYTAVEEYLRTKVVWVDTTGAGPADPFVGQK
jgi:acyl-CoA reductase-like NAD-dependent aldehyde dehydrogenase